MVFKNVHFTNSFGTHISEFAEKRLTHQGGKTYKFIRRYTGRVVVDLMLDSHAFLHQHKTSDFFDDMREMVGMLKFLSINDS